MGSTIFNEPIIDKLRDRLESFPGEFDNGAIHVLHGDDGVIVAFSDPVASGITHTFKFDWRGALWLSFMLNAHACAMVGTREAVEYTVSLSERLAQILNGGAK